MTNINKHGYIMNGLRYAASVTRNLPNRFGSYVDLAYNMETGEVRAAWHVTESSWTQWNDENVIGMGKLCRKTTMQEIADMIAYNIPVIRQKQKEYAEDMARLDADDAAYIEYWQKLYQEA